MLQTQLQTLHPHIDLFKQTKEEILHRWVDQEIIKGILHLHDIDINRFINYYAAGVFDYFISVMKGETPLGTCPVMEEFLAYLKDRNFHADELFILCSHFKKSMVDTSYTHHINTQDIFDAISFLFDANFSGILRLYTDTIYQKEQVIAKSLTLLNEYKNAIDVSAIVAKTDTEGIITYASDNFCKLSGYTKEELIGANHSIVSHPDTPIDFFKDMWKAIKSNNIFKGTIKNTKKDGSIYYIDLTIVPLSNPMQGVLEYISIGYDVTNLVQAKEEAFEASKAKEHFLSAMSHEIRTPLNAILGFISILQEETNDDLHKHYLDIIAHSGKHLLHIINDILDFSKLKNSQITLNNTSFNTLETFGQLIELYTQSAKDKTLTLDATISPDLPQFIHADAMRIQQVISNLLGNAIKFTPKKGVVKILIDYEDQKLRIKVQDNGIGMTKEVQESVFKPFIQVSKDHEGTGLGLAITRELVTAMQGSITLQSREYEGTCFTVMIPIKLQDTAPVALLEEAPTSNKKYFKAHLLVAEDNQDNQELITLLLKRFGLTFELVDNGVAALKSFKERTFDMIILDDEMPQLKGHQTAAHIRSFEKQNNKTATPIMILSANATKQVQDRAIRDGCDIFLTKPIDPNKLTDALGLYLQEVPKLDKASLSKELFLDVQELDYLLKIFEKNLPINLNALQKAISQNKPKEISKIAHKIKGSASNFRFENLMCICSDIQSQAEKNENTHYLSLIKKLDKAIKNLGLDDITLT